MNLKKYRKKKGENCFNVKGESQTIFDALAGPNILKNKLKSQTIKVYLCLRMT